MKAMQGESVKKRVHVTGSAEGTWKALIAWDQHRAHAERDHIEEEFENIAMQRNEDHKLFACA